VDGVERSLEGTDVIVTATTASEPVIRREWITAGAHLNAVGASIPSARELDTATVAAASLFVDRRESAENEAGDYLFALREKAIASGHIRAEIGEVLTGEKPGRTCRDEITIFKSLGLAVEDLAAADYLYTKATAAGVGARLDF
jgi:ornithine cyclodeaminase/alanine dehydrogenase-like protein (mu-crystallin family)